LFGFLKKMKKIIIISFTLFALYAKAQNSIVNILDQPADVVPNAYYKDINNVFDNYEGTYQYISGNTKLKMTFRKITNVLDYNGKCYIDMLVGEYQYIQNGVEKVNTLNEINIDYANQIKHNLSFSLFLRKNDRQWPCPECSIGEIRLEGQIWDTWSKTNAIIFVRKYTENGLEKIKIIFSDESTRFWQDGMPEPPSFCLPLLQELVLTKI
jgi:hypothetical protein